MKNAASFSRWLILCVLAPLVAVPATASTPMPSDAKVAFLHHSTGGVIWGGGVPGWFDDYDFAHGTSYEITEMAYPDSPYPWDNYPYDYWNIWVSHAGATPYQGQATLELLTPQYDVIVFKHCFPVSGIGPDTGTPDVTSPNKTLENYRLQYAALKAKLRSFPGNRFVVWTGAALRQQDTSPEQAARAKEFFAWVRDTWDEPGDNIYVWDFFALETDGGMYLTPDHASGDSHPNGTFAAEMAPLLGQRIVDVIQGVGDSASARVAADSVAGLSFAIAGPNPSGGQVGFRIVLPAAAHVDLDVFDAAGRNVARIVKGDLAAGTRAVTWDARTAAAGVYFARLRSGGHDLTRRIVRLP
jgi:hypothetical protein